MLLFVVLLLAMAAVLASRSQLAQRGRLAASLGLMALLGLALHASPTTLFGLHVVLIMEEELVGSESALISARVGEHAVIEAVAITSLGLARAARRCVSVAEFARARELAPPAPWVEVLARSQCNPWGLRRTVVAVIPSAELATRMGRAAQATGARDTLAASWERQHIPVSLLHPEDPESSGRLLLSRPYVGASSFPRERVAAYAYQLRPTVAGAAPGTREDVPVRRAGHVEVTRANVPVHPWDGHQQIVGPIPLVHESLDRVGMSEGVHFFRVGEAGAPWLAVTVDDLEVAVLPGDAAYEKHLADRWDTISMHPMSPADLVDLASARPDTQWNNRSQPFARVTDPAMSDAIVVPPGGTAPSEEYMQEGGRALWVDTSCGPLTRHGVVHLIFDHSRLGLQAAGTGVAPNVLQMQVYDTLQNKLRGRSEARDWLPQATPRPSGARSDRPTWQALECGTGLTSDGRLRQARPVVGRIEDDSAFMVFAASPLLAQGCAVPGASLALKEAVRAEYLPSHVAARIHALALHEPQLKRPARLDGTTIVVFALEARQLGVDQFASLTPSAFGWGSPSTGPTTGALDGFSAAEPWKALEDLANRGAHVYVVPIALPAALRAPGERDPLLEQMLDSATPSSLVRRPPVAGLVRSTAWSVVASPADAIAVGEALESVVLRGQPPRSVGAPALRDPRFRGSVTLYDDVCASGDLLEATPRLRGVLARARYDLFSPTNWLMDEGTNIVSGERTGASRQSGRSRVGLGAQVLADVVTESARPFGNRRSAGASSVAWQSDGWLRVVAPATLRVGAGSGSGSGIALAGTSIGGGQLAAHAFDPKGDAAAWVRLVAEGGATSQLALHSPPGPDPGGAPFRWLPAVQATGGYVLQSGALADYHRTSLWPFAITLVAALATALAFSPVVTPWAVQTWRAPARDRGAPAPQGTRLTLSEQALIAEAGQAAGLIVARRTAGEPEGERGFVAGDSPSAILALSMYSMTAHARARGTPQLVARVRTRRAQQVPQVTLLIDTGGFQRGLQGTYLRAAAITVSQVVSRIALMSGASVALQPLADGEEWLTLQGASDDAAVAGAIAHAPALPGGPRVADEVAGSGLCVIVSPVDAFYRHALVEFASGLRAQSTRCLVVHASLRAVELPGMYLVAHPYAGVVSRQRYGARGRAAEHDRDVSRELDQAGVPAVLWTSRRRSIAPLCDALAHALEGPA